MSVAKMRRGQSSIEFMYLVGFSLALFAAVLMLLYYGQADQSNLADAANARRLCNAIAAQITKTAAAGSGTTAELMQPPAGRNYTIFISSAGRFVSVSYGSGSAGCSFAAGNVSNGTAYSFITNSTRIRGIAGGVVIG